MPYADVGPGSLVAPGLKTAHKDAKKVVNNATFSIGSILRVNGVSGNVLTTIKATNASAAGASGTLYMAIQKSQDEANKPGHPQYSGKAVPFGVIAGGTEGGTDGRHTGGVVDTSAATVGDAVYLDTAGGWTLTKPTAALVRRIGTVIKVSATVGEILFDGTQNVMRSRVHGSTVVSLQKAVAGAATCVFSAANIGTNLDACPVAVGKTTDGTTYVLGYAWNGSGQLTVTFNAAFTGTCSVAIFPEGDTV